MRVTVVGGGVVGNATAKVFTEHCDVRVYDTDPCKRTHSTMAEAVDGADMVFVCVPEAAVEAVLTSLEDKDLCVALRSTVPVGTTHRLRLKLRMANLVHYPEFLTARCAAVDAFTPTRHLVGSPLCRGKTALVELLRNRFPGTPLYLTTSDESEAAKLLTNAFFAVKIGFFNEARTLCDALDLDWGRVVSAVLADGRISHSHTMVPGPDNRRGWGGACLRKDMLQLVQCYETAGLDATLCKATMERNERDRA